VLSLHVLSVRLPVCPVAAAGLLLSAVRAEDTDRQRRRPAETAPQQGAAARRSAAKCGQCHVENGVKEAEHISYAGIAQQKNPLVSFSLNYNKQLAHTSQ